MRVGLFGGSFNPPHQGHLHISGLAIKKLGLHQIWWIPTAHNNFKDPSIYESYDTRCNKCLALIKSHPKIYLKKFDQVQTAKLVKTLQKEYPNYDFIWIAGADNLERLHEWSNFKQLINMLPFAIFSREDFLLKIRQTKSFQIYKKLAQKNSLPQFRIFKTQNLNISSTKLRKNAKLHS